MRYILYGRQAIRDDSLCFCIGLAKEYIRISLRWHYPNQVMG